MGKINNRTLGAALKKYLLPCFIVCAVGCIAIEGLSIYLQDWFSNLGSSFAYDYGKGYDRMRRLYFMAKYSRILLVPTWAVLCLCFTVKAFLQREITAPVDTLMKASDRILSDDLDFHVQCDTDNELGRLCGSFENMRLNLYNSSYSLWKSLEERKMLNSAFSHDLRTPITVLSGYMELLRSMGGRLSGEKQREITEKMAGQTERLKNYTEKMSSIHRLEDIIPDIQPISLDTLCSQIRESGVLLCGEDVFSFTSDNGEMAVYTDMGLVMEIFLNLASNAQRYMKSRVECGITMDGDMLKIAVSDDGCGFSEEAVRKAWKPFYRDEESDNDKNHFGLGLYICWLLCRKLGGRLTVENGGNGGGMVTAEISAKSPEIKNN